MFGQESRLIIMDRELKVVVNRTLYFGPTTSLSWSGELLAASSQDEVTVWSFNPDQGLSLLRVLRGWGREASRLSWYPDSERFAASYQGLGQPIRVLNKEGEEVFQIIDQDLLTMNCPVVSSDARMLAGVAGGYEVRIWDASDGRLGARFNTNQAIVCLEWNPTQPRILAVAGREEVEIWDVTDPGQGASIRIRPGPYPNCLAWSPRGDLLAVGTHEGVEIWDIQKSLLLQAITMPQVSTVVWSADDARLAVLSRYLESDRKGSDLPAECQHLNLLGRVTVWSVQREYRQGRGGAEVNVTLTLMSERFIAWPDPRVDGGLLAWSPNSTLLAVGTGSTELITGKDPGDCPVAVQPGVLIQRIDQETGAMRTVQFLGPVIRPVSSVAWSPDGSRVLAACQDATIRIWRVGPGNAPQMIGNSAVVYLALVPILTILLHVARKRNKDRNR